MDKKAVHYSDHAHKRMQQRGINSEMTELILRYANKKAHVKGQISKFISKSRLAELKEQDKISASMVDSLNGIGVVLADNNSKNNPHTVVVTVMHISDKLEGRHYRKTIKIRTKRHR